MLWGSKQQLWCIQGQWESRLTGIKTVRKIFWNKAKDKMADGLWSCGLPMTTIVAISLNVVPLMVIIFFSLIGLNLPVAFVWQFLYDMTRYEFLKNIFPVWEFFCFCFSIIFIGWRLITLQYCSGLKFIDLQIDVFYQLWKISSSLLPQFLPQFLPLSLSNSFFLSWILKHFLWSAFKFTISLFRCI